MSDSEIEDVARSICLATGEDPETAWRRHTGAARDWIRRVHGATPANDLQPVRILGVLRDEEGFFPEGPVH